MKTGKWFAVHAVLLITMAAFTISSNAAGEGIMKNTEGSKDSESSENIAKEGIPCNWDGWSNTYPEVKCGSRWPCNRYEQILKMKCTAGTVEEVMVDRVCVSCEEPPGI